MEIQMNIIRVVILFFFLLQNSTLIAQDFTIEKYTDCDYCKKDEYEARFEIHMYSKDSILYKEFEGKDILMSERLITRRNNKKIVYAIMNPEDTMHLTTITRFRKLDDKILMNDSLMKSERKIHINTAIHDRGYASDDDVHSTLTEQNVVYIDTTFAEKRINYTFADSNFEDVLVFEKLEDTLISRSYYRGTMREIALSLDNDTDSSQIYQKIDIQNNVLQGKNQDVTEKWYVLHWGGMRVALPFYFERKNVLLHQFIWKKNKSKSISHWSGAKNDTAECSLKISSKKIRLKSTKVNNQFSAQVTFNGDEILIVTNYGKTNSRAEKDLIKTFKIKKADKCTWKDFPNVLKFDISSISGDGEFFTFGDITSNELGFEEVFK